MTDDYDIDLQYEFKTVRDEAIWLCQIVDTFNVLFHSDHETETLLRTCAGHFFSDLNRILHEYFYIVVCRLTGPQKTGNLDNPSTQRLTHLLKNQGCKSCITDEILCLGEKLQKYGKRMQPARNKIIAHCDRETYHKQETLGGHSEQEFQDFLINLQKYCDAVGNTLGIGPLDFRHPSAPSDVLDLLKILQERHLPLMTNDKRVEWTRKVLDYLNANHCCCTYGALGGLLGLPARSVGQYLGSKRSETSWIVRAKDGRPSDFANHEIHPKHPVLQPGRRQQPIRCSDTLSRMVWFSYGVGALYHIPNKSK